MSERIITERHWLLVVNPEAGKRKIQHRIDYISQKIEDAGIPFYLRETEYEGHAVEIAKKYARRGCLNFLILGGDGTINEVINGIFSANIEDTSLVKIAVVPTGTGNDWARFWNMRKDDRQAMKYFLQGHTKLVDVGKVEYQFEKHEQERFFINSIGFGLDALATDIAHRYKKTLGNFSFIYILALLLALLKMKIQEVNLHIDEKEKVTLPLLTMNIGNAPYTGGGVKQNPLALPYDSVFHMMTIGKLTFREVVTLLANLFNGKLTNYPKVQTYKAKEVIISSNKDLMAETDGVLLDNALEYKITILPEAIQMIVPKNEI